MLHGVTRHDSRASDLDAMIEEATVDCYNESEQATGIFTMMQEHLALPFQTVVLGTSATVVEIDITDRDEIVAVCTSGSSGQRVRIIDLRLPTPPPVGAKWIDAYCHWLGEA
jgi:hypothetical protein